MESNDPEARMGQSGSDDGVSGHGSIGLFEMNRSENRKRTTFKDTWAIWELGKKIEKNIQYSNLKFDRYSHFVPKN